MKLLKKLGCIVLGAAIGLGSFGTVPALGAYGSVIKVGKGSGYDYSTVSEALKSINYTPTKLKPVTVLIDKGVYEESFSVSLPYVTLENKGKAEDVVITYDKSSGNADLTKRAGTEKTATVSIDQAAKGFKAINVTFENSYNLEQEEEYSQAVALVSNADEVMFEGCRFIGRQDTLYLKGASKGADARDSANPARVCLDNCYIEGTVDFIFGDATAVFENCSINMAYRKDGGYFTAPNTTLYNTGFVFDGCRFSVDEKYTAQEAENIYLGRPWQCDADHPSLGSETVIMNSQLPEKMNPQGFSLWDGSTVKNKVRFFEYNNKVKGLSADTSKRADFVKILSETQATGFKPYNVLRGDDMWNPCSFEAVINKPAAELTLGEYSISVPKGETYRLESLPLPVGAVSAASYTTGDPKIAEIDKDGTIKAVETGTTTVSAALENGMTVSAQVVVSAARTEPPIISDISITTGSSLDPGDRLRGSYSFEIKEDEANDTSLVRWIASDPETGEEYILSESRELKDYVVTDNETGSYIKLEVRPESATSYGKTGETKSYKTPTVVTGERKSLLKEGFKTLSDKWETYGTIGFVSDGENSFVSGGSDTNAAADGFIYNENITKGNYTMVLRERFNPDVDGLSGDSYEDIFLNRSDADNYYKIRITRGGNTKSLRWYIIKCINGTEETLASDETSMKDKVMQNSGENNPYFRIEITKKDNKISAKFVLEENLTVLSQLSADFDTALSAGRPGIEMFGKTKGILIDYMLVSDSAEAKKEPAARIFIAGDSTAKNYGDENTIGGWGEYIPYYFSEDVEIINKAEGGRSSRSFINQGRLDEICREAHKGDYVFIQFGINDGQTEDNYRLEYMAALGEPDANGIYPYIQPVRVPTPQVLLDAYKDTEYPYGETFYPYEGGTFKWYLKQYVDRVRETGATPVLMTSICRVFFDADGKITPHHGENDGYIKAVLQVAEETDCALIDFYEITKNLYESYGYSMVQGLANIKADGSMDLTHYNKFGANIIASKFAAAVKDAGLGLEGYVTASRADVERTDGLKSAKLWLVGDEYAADYSSEVSSDIRKRSGIGEYIPEYMSSLIETVPMGVDGASSKSYADTENYKKFMDGLSEGDYVVIHFGTNDKTKGDGFTSPDGDKETEGSFQYYLYNNYVKPIKEKRAVPIIITPISQYCFKNGEFVYTDGGYAEAAKSLAADQQIYFCNMTENMAAIYKENGEEGSKRLNAYGRDGLIDDILSDTGARKAALSFLNAMKFSSSTFKDYIQIPDEEPVDYITRGEFAKLIADTMELKGTGLFTFSDMPMGRDYVSACNLLKENNIAKGDEKNCFYPENMLTGKAYNELIQNTAASLGIKYTPKSIAGEGLFMTYDDAVSGIIELYESR